MKVLMYAPGQEERLARAVMMSINCKIRLRDIGIDDSADLFRRDDIIYQLDPVCTVDYNSIRDYRRREYAYSGRNGRVYIVDLSKALDLDRLKVWYGEADRNNQFFVVCGCNFQGRVTDYKVLLEFCAEKGIGFFELDLMRNGAEVLHRSLIDIAAKRRSHRGFDINQSLSDAFKNLSNDQGFSLGESGFPWSVNIAYLESANLSVHTLKCLAAGVFHPLKSAFSLKPELRVSETKVGCHIAVQQAMGAYHKGAVLIAIDTQMNVRAEQAVEEISANVATRLDYIGGSVWLKYVVSGPYAQAVSEWLNGLSQDMVIGGLQLASTDSQLSGAIKDLVVSAARPATVWGSMILKRPIGKKLPKISLREAKGFRAKIVSPEAKGALRQLIEARTVEILAMNDSFRRLLAPEVVMDALDDEQPGSLVNEDRAPREGVRRNLSGPFVGVDSTLSRDSRGDESSTNISAVPREDVRRNEPESSVNEAADSTRKELTTRLGRSEACRRAGLAALARAGWSVTGGERQQNNADSVRKESAASEAQSVLGDKSQRGDAAIELPHEYLCPIALCLMDDPVVAEDGYTYERDAIEQLFKNRPGGDVTSPLTRQSMGRNLVPNRTMKSGIEQWKTENPSYVNSGSGPSPG